MSALREQIQELRESLGRDMLDKIVDRKASIELYQKIKKDDPQAAQLYREVLMYLADKLTPQDPGVESALNRVLGMLSHGQTWDAGLLRNNVFKAANSLGMKLPSSMF